MNEDLEKYLVARPAGHAVIKAINALLETDRYLLEVDANERSIAHRFAVHLQAQLPELNIDCEYNRDGVDPKRIEHFDLDPNSEDTEAKTVFPDIIAHVRGTKRNYLVIELKKSTNRVDRRVDYGKLAGYKRDLGYDFALYVELYAGNKSGVAKVEWVDA